MLVLKVNSRLILLVSTFFMTGGCGWLKRPYHYDPLLRGGYGIRGDYHCAHNYNGENDNEPTQPIAPIPTHLPTLEWER
jgi:hypothetical protein